MTRDGTSRAGSAGSSGFRKEESLFTAAMLVPSMVQAVWMLDPRTMVRNPVMFVAELGAALTTLVTLSAAISGGDGLGYFLAVSLWLWLTVWFANFAEAVAEARGRAQAASLRRARRDVTAHRVVDLGGRRTEDVPASQLRTGDVVLVGARETIPADGEVIEGVAPVDESAITGESAPVIRESGGDRSAVTGGTRVLSDHLTIRVTARPGESFLDRMIAMVEGAVRQKMPNEIALTVVLAGLTLVFLLVCVTLYPIARYFDVTIDVPTLVALLVCLIPTTIGAPALAQADVAVAMNTGTQAAKEAGNMVDLDSNPTKLIDLGLAALGLA
jgi:K+-transporting ATPase ATPase B chain